MLYTVIVNKKILIEAVDEADAKEFALKYECEPMEEVIAKVYPTTRSEKIYFGLNPKF